jgi:hypothetical protein
MLFSLKFAHHFDILIITSENDMPFVTFFFFFLVITKKKHKNKKTKHGHHRQFMFLIVLNLKKIISPKLQAQLIVIIVQMMYSRSSS